MDLLDATPGDSTDTREFRPPQIGLPARLRLLCIANCEPSWINLTLQLNANGCHEPHFRWVSSGRESLAVLRDQCFDCVLIHVDEAESRRSGQVELASPTEAVALIQSVRGGGYDDPLILITPRLNDTDWGEICRHDCEIVITPHQWDSPALVSVIRCAVERVELRRENHRLSVGNHRRLVRERDEAEQLLSQQRQILEDLSRLSETVSTRDIELSADDSAPNETLTPSTAGPSWQRFSTEIASFYHELLRAYVIMGSGGLTVEIAKVAELIAFTGLKPREAMQLHLERVEALVRGLGSRSSRHVMARADLMALELMIHLAESYQKKA
jgi:hypothetical protein